MSRPKADQGRLFDPPGASGVPSVRRYVDRQLTAQRSLGQLEPVDDGLIGVVRAMSSIIDAEVRKPAASAYVILTGLAKLSPVLLELRGERHDGPGGGLDVELEQITAQVAAALRDAEGPGATHPG